MQYRLTFAESTTHTPKHPERTAVRCISSDYDFHEYSTVEAMEKALNKQDSHYTPSCYRWTPCAVLLKNREERRKLQEVSND